MSYFTFSIFNYMKNSKISFNEVVYLRYETYNRYNYACVALTVLLGPKCVDAMQIECVPFKMQPNV
jgi:hypothetical protein